MYRISYRAPRRIAALAGVAALTALVGIVSPAHAGPWNGEQPASYTGGNLYTVVGNTVTITAGVAKSYLTVPNAGISNQQILGINAFYIVDTSGNTIPGIAASANNGYVQNPNPVTYWPNASNPAGYNGGNGFGQRTPWLQLASDADVLAGAGKQPSGYTLGTFVFSVPIPANATWGIDYLVADGAQGKTGRAFGTTVGFNPTGTPVDVPETGTVAFGVIFGLGLVGGAIRARRKA